MYIHRLVNSQKLRNARGVRTRSELSQAVEGKVSIQDIYCYEKGIQRPSLKKLPYLLKALGVEFEAISDPVELNAEI